MQQESYVIREGVPSDAPKITEFNIMMALETEGILLDREKATRGVVMLFEKPEKGQYFVAVHKNGSEETIVGACLVTYEWSDWRCCDYWWMQSVFVDKEHRRRGVFTQLFKYVEKKCIEAKSASFRLYVDKKNANAKSTYLKLGMQESHYEMCEMNFYE
ncbi:hypothetical protein C9374_005839 [Naegleria lovaniensis]|uniref:N-acetyltransferase domain-containing protein n=1 Tax=Naegleria lovaniensis TaxID=51637 RepID=A0AA88GPD6_NAELO|nr:uncharacterized protein C9374_005839 [Naegleria lovaniensis]KAG2382047.1 hypothetical protein C9374_005839 [Naegleria lovaniensis]